jgi:hypothetical protein
MIKFKKFQCFNFPSRAFRLAGPPQTEAKSRFSFSRLFSTETEAALSQTDFTSFVTCRSCWIKDPIHVSASDTDPVSRTFSHNPSLKASAGSTVLQVNSISRARLRPTRLTYTKRNFVFFHFQVSIWKQIFSFLISKFKCGSSNIKCTRKSGLPFFFSKSQFGNKYYSSSLNLAGTTLLKAIKKYGCLTHFYSID